jgi:hypothetical protein
LCILYHLIAAEKIVNNNETAKLNKGSEQVLIAKMDSCLKENLWPILNFNERLIFLVLSN